MNHSKKIIISAFIFLLLLGGLGFGVYKTVYQNQSQDIRSRAANEQAVVKFAGGGNVNIGDTFSLSATIEPVSQTAMPKLSAAAITVIFPADKLQLKTIAPYPQGPLPILLGTGTVDNQNATGKIVVVAACTAAGCQTQSAGFLATMTFTAKAAGTATVSFAAGDATQIAVQGVSGALPVKFEAMTISIAAAAAQPTVIISPTPIKQVLPTLTSLPALLPTEVIQPPSSPPLPEPTTCTTEYVCTPGCAANEDPEYKRACANPEPYRNFPQYSACFTATPVCQ